MRAEDINSGILARSFPGKKKLKKNWKKELKLERGMVIDEVIAEIKNKARVVPKEWLRGYNSAITTLEKMKGESATVSQYEKQAKGK